MKGLAFGILLLAHGGGPRWNQEIERIRAALDAKIPVETALGMAETAAIGAAVKRLEARGAAKIVAVPLFVNSSSEVMDQTRYVLGLRGKPSEVFLSAMARLPAHAGAHGHSHHASAGQVPTSLPLVLAPALDDHPLVARILLARAKALSREPARETVILVGHGPVDDHANETWLKTLESLAKSVRKQGAFKAARAATIRDDSPEDVKARAAARLRSLIKEANQNGATVVVPYLIAQGGIEDHIEAIIKGMPYAWDGRTICPDPLVARWVEESALAAAKKPGIRGNSK